jgi:hypothetical protein
MITLGQVCAVNLPTFTNYSWLTILLLDFRYCLHRLYINVLV